MTKEGLVTRNEAILLVIVGIFAVLWMVLFIPFLSVSLWFQNQIPPVQFVLYELGFLFGLVAAFGFPIQYTYYRLKRNFSARKSDFVLGAIKIGVSGWALNKLVMDMWESPYYLSSNGTVLLNNPLAMTGSAVDATITWIWQHIGATGFILYFTVYVVTPLSVLVVIILAFTWKRVVRIFGG